VEHGQCDGATVATVTAANIRNLLMEGTERGPVEADGSPAIEVHRRGCASSCTLSSPGTTVGTIKGGLGVPGSESPYVLSSRGVHVGAAQSLSSGQNNRIRTLEIVTTAESHSAIQTAIIELLCLLIAGLRM
jgi:hypothetical protein